MSRLLRSCFSMCVLFLGFGTARMLAQGGSCRDPWINQTFNQIYHRAPQGSGTTGECNINLYGGGQWSNYQDLYNKVLGSKDCQDPWIGEAYIVALNRHASGNACLASNYGGGRWSSFGDLVSKVQQYNNQAARSTPAPQPVTPPPSTTVSGCKDAWITQAFNQIYHRAPQGSGTTGECNINLYGGGQWSNYQDLYNKVLGSKDCPDPWIGEAYIVGLNRHASGNACLASNYGGGRWSSFGDLVSKVQQAQNQPSSQPTQPVTGPGTPGNNTPPSNNASGPCRDAWVNQAVQQVRGRRAFGSGDVGECNPALYGANWSSYPDLLSRVQQSSRALDQAGLEYGSNGLTFNDKKYFETILGTGWVGPSNQAPRDKNWHIALVAGYELAINRKCPPNEASAGAGTGSGCIAGHAYNSPPGNQGGFSSPPGNQGGFSSPPPQNRPGRNLSVALVSQMGSKCLDVEGGRISGGAHLIGYPCNGQNNEQFTFQSNGTLTLGGLCVDSGAGNRDGDQLFLWNCVGAPSQRWRLSSGQLVGATGKCVDLKGGSGWWFGNQPAIIYGCNGQPNQHWIEGVVIPTSRIHGIAPTQPGQLASLAPVNASAGVIAAGGANVIAAGGANVIAAGGGNVIAAGGGNVIAAGGANVIAAGGANVIAAGGANAIVLAQP